MEARRASLDQQVEEQLVEARRAPLEQQVEEHLVEARRATPATPATLCVASWRIMVGQVPPRTQCRKESVVCAAKRNSEQCVPTVPVTEERMCTRGQNGSVRWPSGTSLQDETLERLLCIGDEQ